MTREKLLDLIITRPAPTLGSIIGFTSLTSLHDEWIRETWDAPKKMTALQAARGTFKTSSVIICGIIRRFLLFPQRSIILRRKTFTDASVVGNAISNALDLPAMQEVFEIIYNAPFRKTEDSKKRISTVYYKPNGRIEAQLNLYGIYDSITGAHTDDIVDDDIITLADRFSKAEREKTKQAFYEQQNVIKSVSKTGNSGSKARQIFLGTPWHGKDAWQDIKKLTPVLQYPASKIWLSLFSQEELDDIRTAIPPALFAANYELELKADESLLFSDPLYPMKWDYTVRGAVAQLDTAFDGDHYNALTIAAPTRKEGSQQFYQAVGFTYSGNVEDWETDIKRLCRQYRVTCLYVETNADKGASAKRLSGRGLRVKPYTESMNKHIKIGTYLYRVWKYVEWADETDEEYMLQLTEYKEGVEPDDAPDSAASLFREGFSQASSSEREKWKW